MKIVNLVVDLVRTAAAAAAGVAGIPVAEHAGIVAAAAGPERPVWGWSQRNSSRVWGCWPGHACNDPGKHKKSTNSKHKHERTCDRFIL